MLTLKDIFGWCRVIQIEAQKYLFTKTDYYVPKTDMQCWESDSERVNFGKSLLGQKYFF